MLTNAAARAAGARARAYKVHDQGGMHLLVRPTGTKSWQQKYRWHGREKLLTLGQFPQINVAQARIRQAEAKDALERGLDPSKVPSSADTFERLARAWHRHHRGAWSPAHAADVLASLERDIFPSLGERAIDAIQPRELLELVRAVEVRGCLETAGRLRQRLSAIFGFGIAEGLCQSDPAAQLGRAMTRGKLSTPHPALTDIGECRALLAACEGSSAAAGTVAASRFLALTAVRLAAVRGMRWEEVDLEARTWTVPAARMKLSRAKKGEARFEHIIPLSEAALFVLRGMAGGLVSAGELSDSSAPVVTIRKTVDAGGLVFPGRGGDQPIGAGALRDLYVRLGYAGRHVPHGWRSSFSTILNETMGEEWRHDIDRALAHAGMGKVEAAYNRSQLLDRRRTLLNRWGELLSGTTGMEAQP